jgi:hypothetical protein
VPSEPPSPDKAFEEQEVKDRIRAAIASLPPRERTVIGLYYYGEATMKQIGAEIGVNESRVSQLHARAVQRLKKALGADSGEEIMSSVLVCQKTIRRMRMAKAELSHRAKVLPYKTPAKQPMKMRRSVAHSSQLAVAR